MTELVHGLDSINCGAVFTSDDLDVLLSDYCSCGRIPSAEHVAPIVTDLGSTFQVKPSQYILCVTKTDEPGNNSSTAAGYAILHVTTAAFPANPGGDGVLVYRVPSSYSAAGAVVPPGGASVGYYEFISGQTSDTVGASIAPDGYVVIAEVVGGVVQDGTVACKCLECATIENLDATNITVDGVLDLTNATIIGFSPSAGGGGF